MSEPEGAVGEPRWPVTLAVLVLMALSLTMPGDLRIAPDWLVPAVLGMLTVTLTLGDPGRITRRSTFLRWVSIALVAVLALSAIVYTARLIHELVVGGPDLETAGSLLRAGGAVWLGNCIAFALLYWEFDCGGAAARAHGLPPSPAFAFPQQLKPELAPAGWRPTFVDYLYVGFTNGIAFSPTDAMPLARWAKLAMTVQAVTSFAILGLVIARAVNVFT